MAGGNPQSYPHASEGGGDGGSGVVIIQYPGAQRGAGGTISCVSCKTQHLFSSTGAFLSENPGGSAVTLDYLLIGGGGGGGGNYGGGGGAGGYITSYSTPPVSATTLWEGSAYNVVVGGWWCWRQLEVPFSVCFRIKGR